MGTNKSLLFSLALAKKRLGFCAPNPAVGSVIVKKDRILGEGYHWGCGHPHAEIVALKQAGIHAKGATLYVTLEPCCHTGRTPPCTDAIIKAGITRVVYGYQDPNPLVKGQGAQALNEAGIETCYCPLPEIDAFYRPYQYWTTHRRPWVIAKLAISLDGKIAGPHGKRVQLTGAALAKHTHEQRLHADALLTTAETVLNDNPQMNVRLTGSPIAKPVYVLDRRGRLSGRENIFKTALFVTPLSTSLEDSMTRIAEDGYHTVWVEAGGRCFSALFEHKLIHKAYLYIAPKLLGPAARSGFHSSDDIFAAKRSIKWYNYAPDALCEIDF